jgi:predicted phosphodiesterase
MKILVVGDLHCPYTRKGYLEFCKDIKKEYKCDTVVFIGDVVDFSAVSFHQKNPEMKCALDEYNGTLEQVKLWYEAFPNAKVCLGNHDLRIIRVAGSVNIPSQMLKSFNQLWGTPKWEWNYDYVIDNIFFTHGTGNGGMYPAYNLMKKLSLSTVLGHWHSAAGVKFLVNPYKRMFALDVGCGVDDRQLAFQYAQYNKVRSVISCAVILNGHPHLIEMPMGKNEKYHDSRF